MTAIYALIVAKFILLTLFEIGENNVFKKLYDLVMTACFIFVDVMIVYPSFKITGEIASGGLLFVFWLVILHIQHIMSFLTSLTGDKR